MIVLPAALNYDTLIEVLLKVRAAKTFGASRIVVQSSIPLKAIPISGALSEVLSLEQFLAVAGADEVIEKETSRELTETKSKRNAVTQADYWVGGTNHPQLIDQTSRALGKSPVGFEALRGAPESVKGRKIYWIAGIQAPVNEQLFTTLAQIKWIEEHGGSVHLVTPYLPYARSDKPEFDVGVTTQGRLVADLIEAVGTEGITVVRAHAPQSLGFFKIHSEEIAGRKTIVDHLRSQQIDCVISPDAGFQKDATKYQHDLIKSYGGQKEVCLVVMNKERNSDGKETILGGTGLEKIEGKNVVIIDDETATGGTLAQVAKALKNYPPKAVFAVVTHLAGTAKQSLGSDAIQSLVVTNTVPISLTDPKLTVLSIAPEIAESISRSELNR